MAPEWFNKYFKSKQVSVETERIVQSNNPEFNSAKNYAKNKITTSKYNELTFLPLNLFEQFHRVANLYFLLLIILQFIPQITSLNPVTTVLPLLFVLAVTAVKDAIDDWRRRNSDKKVNNREVTVIRNGQKLSETWQNVVVGDIVYLKKDDAVTADMIVLFTSEPTGFCLIETAELDGETNLKVRQAVEEFSRKFQSDPASIAHYKCEVHCELPNNNLTKFEGAIYDGPVSTMIDGSEVGKKPLTNDNILLRGCTVRATDWVYGLVIYTGKDTKLMKNSGAKRHKVTSVDVFLNRAVIGIFISMLVCCFICTMYDLAWERDVGVDFQTYQTWPEFMPKNIAAFFILQAIMIFLSYFILFNTFVPVSLYVSVEVVRLAQSILITWDKEMYYPETDTPTDVKNTSLSEELGQIQYLFSDKTGTLTQNVMTLNKCSIYCNKYGDVLDTVTDTEFDPYEDPGKFVRLELKRLMTPDADPNFEFYDRRLVEAIHNDNSPDSDSFLRHYFRLMALCNTVVPSRVPVKGNPETTELVYQAQSPDENALISAARSFGYVLHDRNADSLTITEPVGDESSRKAEFPLLHLLDFDNVRKRMSVIVRDPRDNRIILYCKGADSSLFPLAATGQQAMVEQTTQHLHDFAATGLRTLVFGMRELTEEEFSRWKRDCDEASSAIGDRDERVQAVYNEIEKNFVILGASAIEDKLQVGVPLAIRQLLAAGIRMWVLTGDKQETAINIGYSCNLLSPDTNLTVINDDDAAEPGKVARLLKEMYLDMEGEHYTPPVQPQTEKRNMSLMERFRNSLPNTNALYIHFSSFFSEKTLVKAGILPKPRRTVQNGEREPVYGLSITGNALDAILPHLNKKSKTNNSTANIEASTTSGDRTIDSDTEEEQQDDPIATNHLTDLFIKVAGRCSTVVCCRMTPLAKARVVELFRRNLGARTCSIGDGANDVPMIRSANIGVGIAGREGLQAVLASDFAIAQFRFIARLLLVHGRWSYTRMAVFILYFFYKNLTFTFGHLYYAFFCGGTAQTAFDPLYVGLFNTIFTALPCVILGASDQDISVGGMLKFSNLYEVGLKGKLLNLRMLVFTFIESVYAATCIFFFHYGSMLLADVSDLRTFSFTLGFTTLILVTIRCGQDTCYWTAWSHITLWGSIAFYFVVVFGFDPFFLALFKVPYEYADAQYAALNWGPTWLAAASAIALALMPRIFISFGLRCLNPTIADAVREKENNERKTLVTRIYDTFEASRQQQQPVDHSLTVTAATPRSVEADFVDSSAMTASLSMSGSGRRKSRRASRGSITFRESGTGYGFSTTEGMGDLVTGHKRGSVKPIYSIEM